MLKFDSSGLTIDTLAEIIQQIKDDLRAPENFGPEFNPDDDNPLMVHVSRYAIREESLQRGLVEDYNAIDIDQANGVALDNLATLGGSKRAKETFSTVAGLVGGIEGTDVSSKLIRFNVSGELWRLPPNQTIPVGGTLPVIVTAVNPGPVNAFASDDWSIINVTPGFKTFISIADAIRGALAASNNAFRAQYRKELASRGKATAPAVVANLSQNTPGVTNVTIFPNRTNIVDENGVAPHGMELLFEGGTDEDIRQGILENIDISSETSGDISGNVSVNGIEYTLRHSRTDLVPIAISVVLFVADAEVALPVNAIDIVKNAIKAYIDNLETGQNVLATSIIKTLLIALPDGSVTDVEVLIGPFGEVPSVTVFDIGTKGDAVIEVSSIDVQVQV